MCPPRDGTVTSRDLPRAPTAPGRAEWVSEHRSPGPRGAARPLEGDPRDLKPLQAAEAEPPGTSPTASHWDTVLRRGAGRIQVHGERKTAPLGLAPGRDSSKVSPSTLVSIPMDGQRRNPEAVLPLCTSDILGNLRVHGGELRQDRETP